MAKQQPLSKGSLILQEKPFAYIVKSRFIKERCDFCLGSGKLLKCGGCQFSHYCGVLCQRDAWAEHKYECLCMKKIAPRVLPDAARMMAKIIWKLQYGGYLQKFYYSRNGFRKFNDLMPHLDDIKWDENRMEHLQSLHGVLKEYLAPEHFPNDTEFLGIYGRLCINSFNILDDDLNSVGTGIYLAASILDHSCKPNAVAVFDGPQLSIRLIEDIPELNWQNIRISYIDQMDLPETRRAELKKAYYFDCDCERCTDPSVSAKMLAMACPNDKKNCVGSVAPTDEKCKECDFVITDEHRQRFEDIVDMTKQALIEMQNVRCKFDWKKTFLKIFLKCYLFYRY
jgi:[histone H3]-lysine4/36 N-trimethyltransferase SMYD